MYVLTFHVLDIPQKLYISVVSRHGEVDKGKDSGLTILSIISMYKYLHVSNLCTKKKYVDGKKGQGSWFLNR